MNQHRVSSAIRLLPALLLSLAAWSAPAQESQTVIVRPGASAPAATPKPQPRLLTPDEKRASATAPGTLRPERPALPQVAVPLERVEGAEVRTVVRTPRREAAAARNSGRVLDGAARCGALRDPERRADCHENLKATRLSG